MTTFTFPPEASPAFPATLLPLILACVLPLTGCTSGKPGTINRSYIIHAETRSGFVQSVRSRAPRGGRAFGLVEITFHPDYKLVTASSGCRAEVQSVELELVITLPKWRDGKKVPGSIGPHWRRFERTIRQHEMTHVRIARDYAAKMRRAIAASRAASCSELAGRIKTRIKSIKVEHLRAQKQFDRREQKRLKNLL